MAVFTYKALDTQRANICGMITADTPRQARDMLRAKGLAIQEVVGQKAQSKRSRRPFFIGRRYTAQTTSFVLELSTLLSVGIPILEAIEIIAKQHRGHFRSVLLILRDRVSSGQSLADAMREHPAIFDAMAINITKVGQDSGTLDNALERFAQFKERSLQLKNRVATALMYPSIVLITGVVISVFLMTFVVPNLLDSLVESGQELPLATRIVKAVSDMLFRWGWLIALCLFGVAISFNRFIRSGTGRRVWHRFLLKIPVLGNLILKQAIVRFALVVSTLVRSGIVLTQAIKVAKDSTHNTMLAEALDSCEQDIYAGRDVADALAQTNVFPPLVVQIFASGQQSGRLEEMLDRLATDYDRQIATTSQRLTSILEPILILVLAVVVGFIAFATFMPILEAGNVL